jgi:hypothetical protein
MNGANLTCIEKDSFREGGLSGINVSGDSDVSDFGEIINGKRSFRV